MRALAAASTRFRSLSGRGGIRLIPDDGVFFDLDFLDPALLTTSPATIAAVQAYLTARSSALTRASAATVQTSPSTVYASFGVDNPRVGNAGYGQGLVLEESRTNMLPDARDLAAVTWLVGGQPGTLTSNFADGPDGAALADRMAATSGNQHGRYYSFASLANGTFYTASQWAKRPVNGVPSTTAIVLNRDASSYVVSEVALTDAWSRYALAAFNQPTTGVGAYETTDARALFGLAAAARDSLCDLHQVEAGAFATEAIITTGAGATRAADKLTTQTANIVQGDRVGLELSFIPKYAKADGPGTSDVLYMSSVGWPNDTVLFGINNVVVRAGASIVYNETGLNWSAFDLVDFWIEYGGNLPTRCRYRLNGGSVVALPNGAAVPTLGSLSATTSILSQSSPVSCWLRRVRAYAPGGRPLWAA
jgi:hypothetical protein